MTPEPNPPESEGAHSGADPHRPEDVPATPIMCGPRQPTATDLEVVAEFRQWLKSDGPNASRRKDPR